MHRTPLARAAHRLALPTLALLSLLALAACQSLLDPVEVGELTFETEPAAYLAPVPEPTVAGGDAIRVEGYFLAPCRYWNVAGVLAGGGNLVVLEVVGDGNNPPGTVCAAAIETFRWTATIEGLPAGRYDLRVVEVARRWTADPDPTRTTLLETSVTVR